MIFWLFSLLLEESYLIFTGIFLKGFYVIFHIHELVGTN